MQRTTGVGRGSGDPPGGPRSAPGATQWPLGLEGQGQGRERDHPEWYLSRMDHSGDGGVEHDVCGVCAAWGARWRDRLEGGGREKI